MARSSPAEITTELDVDAAVSAMPIIGPPAELPDYTVSFEDDQGRTIATVTNWRVLKNDRLWILLPDAARRPVRSFFLRHLRVRTSARSRSRRLRTARSSPSPGREPDEPEPPLGRPQQTWESAA